MIIETDEQFFNELILKGVKQALPEWNGTAEEGLKLYEDAERVREFRDAYFYREIYPSLSEAERREVNDEIRIAWSVKALITEVEADPETEEAGS